MGNYGSVEAVEFYGDKITALKNESDVYAVAGDILRNIGFDPSKVKNQIRSWNNDIVVSRGIKLLNVLTNGGSQDAYCLKDRYVPLALAKISITPTMQKDQPEIVNKLIRYQEECGLALYNHFHKEVKGLDTDTPLTREEMAMYFTSMMNTFKEYCSTLAVRDSERNKYLNQLLSVQTQNIKDISSAFSNMANTLSLPAKNIIQVSVEDKTEAKSSEPVREENDYSGWRSTMKAACKKAAPILGYSDYKWVIKYITENMRKDFPDFDERYEEYTKNLPGNYGSKIRMISSHEAYRVCFEKYLKDIFSGNVGKVNKVKFNKTPQKFIDVLAKLGKPSPRLYEKVYRRMERDFGVNVDELMEAANVKYGGKCSKAYAITSDDDLFQIFCSAVDSLSQEVK